MPLTYTYKKKVVSGQYNLWCKVYSSGQIQYIKETTVYEQGFYGALPSGMSTSNSDEWAAIASNVNDFNISGNHPPDLPA